MLLKKIILEVYIIPDLWFENPRGYTGETVSMHVFVPNTCINVIEFHYWLHGNVSQCIFKIETWDGTKSASSPRQTHFIASAPQSKKFYLF